MEYFFIGQTTKMNRNAKLMIGEYNLDNVSLNKVINPVEVSKVTFSSLPVATQWYI